jgi:hypothetical protein
LKIFIHFSTLNLTLSKPKFMKKLLFLIIAPFLLSACGPPLVFDIPQEQWDQLSQQQRSQVIDGYNQRQTARAQAAPLVAIADAISAKNSPPKDSFDKFHSDPFFMKRN